MLESFRLALHQGSCIVSEISEYHADEQEASLEDPAPENETVICSQKHGRASATRLMHLSIKLAACTTD